MRTRILILLVLFTSATLTATADDWPQWRGPDRTGKSKETGLLTDWPKDGPELRWKNEEVGTGYSTPSVAGGKVFVLGTNKEEDYLFALGEKDGKQLWSVKLGKVGENPRGQNWPGARSTPTVDGERAYALGSGGDLVCVEAAKGAEVWRKSLTTDFEGKPGPWAYAESPLIDGDVLVCTPGGKKATMVALDKKTGKPVWETVLAQGEVASFSSPIVVEVGKVKQYVTFAAKGVVGVDAKTGKLLWSYGKTSDMAANIVTPVAHDAVVYSTAGRTGGGFVKLTAEGDGIKAEDGYFGKDLAGSTAGGVVLVDGHLYGANRQGLLCIEWPSGKIKWSDRTLGPGAVCFADGMIYFHGEDATVALVTANPEKFVEKGKFKHPGHGQKPAWPHPVAANGGLYLRDQNTLLCYDVKKK